MNEKTDLLQCPRCGALNPRDYKFCGQCGAPLAERRPERTGKPPRLATILLALGCLVVMGSTFLQWSEGLFILPEIICGFGVWPALLALVCLGLTYVETTRGKFSRSTALAQVIMAAVATIPWIYWLCQFLSGAEPEAGFFVAGGGFLLWLVGAILGFGSYAVSAIGILSVALFFVATCFASWRGSSHGEQTWFSWFTEPRVKRVAQRYCEALLAGDLDIAKSMYCTPECIEYPWGAHPLSGDEVLRVHTEFLSRQLVTIRVIRSYADEGWATVQIGRPQGERFQEWITIRYSLDRHCLCNPSLP